MLQTVRLQIFEQSGGSVCFDVMFDMDQFQGFSKDNYLGMYLCQCVCVSSNNTYLVNGDPNQAQVDRFIKH